MFSFRTQAAAACAALPLAVAALAGCGGSNGLSAKSSCSDFNSAPSDDQVRWVRSALDPDHSRNQYSFNGLMDAVTGDCADNPDDHLQKFIDQNLGAVGDN